MAIKTISQFPSGMPTDNDYILFEQNGEGKSATIGDAVNTCTLTYEEIMASTDLSGKVSSASAVKKVRDLLDKRVINAGNLKTIAAIKNWVVQNKPGGPWTACAGDEMCTTVLGTMFNDYLGGYVSFIAFHYFSTSVDIYRFNDGSWDK